MLHRTIEWTRVLYRWRRTGWLWTDRRHGGNEVFCFAETTRRNSAMLAVSQTDAFPCFAQDTLRDGLVRYREFEDLCRYARLIQHRQFAFPCFAHPAFSRHFLDV